MTTGQLSTNITELEKELRKIFEFGQRWKAVVLLDEADVLMSQRTLSDLQRNSIVAGKSLYEKAFLTNTNRNSLSKTHRILSWITLLNHKSIGGLRYSILQSHPRQNPVPAARSYSKEQHLAELPRKVTAVSRWILVRRSIRGVGPIEVQWKRHSQHSKNCAQSRGWWNREYKHP